MNRDLAATGWANAHPGETVGADGKTYTVQPRKPEPPHAVNTDTGEVIDKTTGEVITHLPDHDAAKVPNGPIVSARVRAGPLPDKSRIYHRAARVGCTAALDRMGKFPIRRSTRTGWTYDIV
ncbi:hypothetical protein ACFWQK_09085 [Brachybacterium paraconglomeratum]